MSQTIHNTLSHERDRPEPRLIYQFRVNTADPWTVSVFEDPDLTRDKPYKLITTTGDKKGAVTMFSTKIEALALAAELIHDRIDRMVENGKLARGDALTMILNAGIEMGDSLGRSEKFRP